MVNPASKGTGRFYDFTPAEKVNRIATRKLPCLDRQEPGSSSIVTFVGVEDDFTVLRSGPIEFVSVLSTVFCPFPSNAGRFF